MKINSMNYYHHNYNLEAMSINSISKYHKINPGTILSASKNYVEAQCIRNTSFVKYLRNNLSTVTPSDMFKRKTESLYLERNDVHCFLHVTTGSKLLGGEDVSHCEFLGGYRNPGKCIG